MGKRERLIALVLKYNGDYFKVIKAINDNEEIEETNIDNCFTIFDNIYPKELLELKYPPLVLFYKGNLELLKKEKISIVGSRLPVKYALDATYYLTKANNNKIIVSGLAKGIDGKAHETADYSIGILGCGIDYIYPLENVSLYKKLEKSGLILSEYPYKTKPLAYHFPFRNRIIAALGSSLFVMQSSEKSGTVTTINEALELQKDVKVLPFSIFESAGFYNNKLINDGALMIDENDILINSIDNLK